MIAAASRSHNQNNLFFSENQIILFFRGETAANISTEIHSRPLTGSRLFPKLHMYDTFQHNTSIKKAESILILP